MTTEDFPSDPPSETENSRLQENLERIEELTQRLTSAMARGRSVPGSLNGPTDDLYMKAATAYMAEMMKNPAKIVEQQVSFWGKSLTHYLEAQQALSQGRLEAPRDDTPGDKRFKDPLWQTHPYFNFIKQQYLFNAEAVQNAVGSLEGLSDKERQRLDYFSTQILDMFAPTNFLGTNPEALALAAETEGQSLIDGLENLVADLEANGGDLRVTLSDPDAFRVGENLATTPGEVVYRNHMFELLQYAPSTDEVMKTPLLIFPPWINKFYILDLKAKNSLIKWLVDEGFTVFLVSWINPDESYRDVGMLDYVEDGYLRAMREVRGICDVSRIHVTGYCIAGTTLSLTLALMKERGLDWARTATFFTTLTDFSDQGEVGVFLTDDFVDGIERQVEKDGVLDSFYMSRTFSFLRSNDLIYQPAIKSYMMGQAPPAFDLLHWNGDGTNLPAKMAMEYLRGLCQDDRFAGGEGFRLGASTLHLSDVEPPVFAVACETDHIANWQASYRGVQAMGSTDKTFVLSESGHIAGIINPPSKKKYGHYITEDLSLDPGEWRAGAERIDSTWWMAWADWLRGQSDKTVSARTPGSADRPPLHPAPGLYVTGRRATG